MKIAQIAPIIETVPPKKYGGTERVVYNLTEELVKMGHEVTLFASGDSTTSAKLVSVVPRSLKEEAARSNKVSHETIYGANAYNLLNFGIAYKMQGQFDIIHDHVADLSLPTANISQTPVVVTIHGAFNERIVRMFEELNNVNIVTISKSQGKRAPHLSYAGNVYNGLEMSTYPFSEKHEGYLLFVGRISREKGVHHAINVARKLGLPLIIAAKLEMAEPADPPYYEEFVKPYLNEQIRWVGEVDENERNKLMSKAMAFLHPVTWPEPFGLTLIESMACGCPVVAFSQGSIPEIIQNGKTGFVVETEEQMCETVSKIDQISRSYCRKYSLENFSARKMAEGYLKIYEQAIAAAKILKQPKKEIQIQSIGREEKLRRVYAHQIARSKILTAIKKEN